MDLDRIAQLASDLRATAESERATFGLYRDVHEEDAIARATSDGVVLFAADLLDGLARTDHAARSPIFALDGQTSWSDPQSDITLQAIELYGADYASANPRRLRIAKKEYAAIIGCLFFVVLTTICALVGVFYMGRGLYHWLF